MSTPIVDALRPLFSAPVRGRGEQYFSAGVVEIRAESVGAAEFPTAIEAWVYGEDRYDVSIEYLETNWSLYCTCPAFENQGPCKHLWALVLEIDGERLNLAFQGGSRRRGPPRRPLEASARPLSRSWRSCAAWGGASPAAGARGCSCPSAVRGSGAG